MSDKGIIVDDLLNGKMKLSSIDKECPDIEMALQVRRDFIAHNLPLCDQECLLQDFTENLPIENIGNIYEKADRKCCENVIGYSMVPIGITPRILINNEPLSIPLCTTEGALIASISRGGKAATLSGIFNFSFSIAVLPRWHLNFSSSSWNGKSSRVRI